MQDYSQGGGELSVERLLGDGLFFVVHSLNLTNNWILCCGTKLLGKSFWCNSLEPPPCRRNNYYVINQLLHAFNEQFMVLALS